MMDGSLGVYHALRNFTALMSPTRRVHEVRRCHGRGGFGRRLRLWSPLQPNAWSNPVVLMHRIAHDAAADRD
jgi:hypothetical protein